MILDEVETWTSVQIENRKQLAQQVAVVEVEQNQMRKVIGQQVGRQRRCSMEGQLC